MKTGGRVFVLAALALSASAGRAYALDFNGYVQVGAAVRTGGEPDPVIYNRQLMNTKLQANPWKPVYLRFETDVWNDVPSYDDGHSVRARIREGYARFDLDNADLTIGRQQIAWGQADGIIAAAHAIAYAGEAGMRVCVKSGGHNVSGAFMRGDGMLLDL